MRLFVNKNQIHESSLVLNEDQYHHLSRVYRIRVNELLSVVVDASYILEVKFLKFVENRLFFELKDKVLIDDQGLDITLVQAIPKKDKFSVILDHCTQLGVRRFSPVITEHCVVKWDDKKKRHHEVRWKEKVCSASVQSKQIYMPQVDNIVSFSEFLETVDVTLYDLCLVLWENETRLTLKSSLQDISFKKVCLFVGAEGGLSESEIECLNKKCFKSVTLGNSIYRCEIAGVVALAQLLYAYSR